MVEIIQFLVCLVGLVVIGAVVLAMLAAVGVFLTVIAIIIAISFVFYHIIRMGTRANS